MQRQLVYTPNDPNHTHTTQARITTVNQTSWNRREQKPQKTSIEATKSGKLKVNIVLLMSLFLYNS